MKNIKKIGYLLLVFLFNIYNTCFATIDPDNISDEEIRNLRMKEIVNTKFEVISSYIITGIFVLSIMICSIIIILKIIEKRKDDNGNA